ncbi:histone methyltransferase set2 [Apophysomyces ossiformis]|uniref:SET domain-containing protein 2 n=1 Tax=Apophysomyces ossiformis TaxID=679940 RepID=A0A8H7ETD2_9FUNG|nr:histone methyltransferase set2 [Apophysomyces ossiformis]
MQRTTLSDSTTVSLAFNKDSLNIDRQNTALDNKAITERSCALSATAVTDVNVVGLDVNGQKGNGITLDSDRSQSQQSTPSSQVTASVKDTLTDQFDRVSIATDRSHEVGDRDECDEGAIKQLVDAETRCQNADSSNEEYSKMLSSMSMKEESYSEESFATLESTSCEEVSVGLSRLSTSYDLSTKEHRHQLPDNQMTDDAEKQETHEDGLKPDDSLSFSQLPSATADAMETYENISESSYLGSATGKSIAEESMPCDCKYDPEVDDPSAACGDDNFCINRMMFMECMVDDCSCGRSCRNRRFQLRQYARVDVIRTEKKGYGLRALTDLPSNAFIMEYLGEVIPHSEFIQRTRNYEREGLKHYYFMTLKTDEIIDATKKGCLARFINHSCNPNCVTQKWVVGKKMRIGIFTSRSVQAGEELTFDYKFERYGAVAQKCYCGEANCKGYIGATDKKAEEESIDVASPPSDGECEVDSGETTPFVTHKPKRNRRIVTRPLADPDEVQSFVKKMLDSVGKASLVNKLLHRLESTNPNTTRGKEILKTFIRLHGLKMLKFWLGEWKTDNGIVSKVLNVLERLPLVNKNGLEDCKMFDVVHKFTTSETEEIASRSKLLLDEWNQLKSVYRIPKRKATENHAPLDNTSNDNADESKQFLTISPTKKMRFTSTREFFDADDDYYEYLSLYADANEIRWKIEYPPVPIIPTAPRAMLSSYDYYGRVASNNDSYEYDEHTYMPYSTLSINKPTDPWLKYYGDMTEEMSRRSGLYGDTVKLDISSRTLGPSAVVSERKLPLNWRSAICENGYVYYYNKITGKTQWEYPDEKVSSIEGVSQSQIASLVEKAILDTERKKREQTVSRVNSPSSAASKPATSPRLSRRSSIEAMSDPVLDETELKKEVGKVVIKYLSSKHTTLWRGDKHMFKELARKMTHHIVNRESHSARKIQAVNSSIRTKIEKFIDAHGSEFAAKISRKKRSRASSPIRPTAAGEINEDDMNTPRDPHAGETKSSSQKPEGRDSSQERGSWGQLESIESSRTTPVSTASDPLPPLSSGDTASHAKVEKFHLTEERADRITVLIAGALQVIVALACLTVILIIIVIIPIIGMHPLLIIVRQTVTIAREVALRDVVYHELSRRDPFPLASIERKTKNNLPLYAI